MSRIIRTSGFQITLSITDPEHFCDRLSSAASQLTDGLILIVPQHDLRMNAEELWKLCNGVPFVQIAADLGAGTPSVIYDQRYGVEKLCDTLSI